MLACSLRIENQVRAELNGGLSLTGRRRLAPSTSYALDGMNFTQGR